VSVKQQAYTGLACSRNYWSCGSLTGLPILQTHRPGLACSRNYWSCSPQPLTELPVLQTHVLVLPAQGVTGLAACSQGYLSCKLTAWQLGRPNNKIHGNMLTVAWFPVRLEYRYSAFRQLHEGVFWRKHAERKYSKY
jgi:hypothetical protein